MAYQTQDRYQLQYFTGTQASIWIGEAWVAECFGISFQATQNLIPIFGYASTTFDAVAKGKVLVQGSFEINFIDEGYLYYVLHKMNAERIREPGEFNESQYILTGEATPTSEVVQKLNPWVQAGRANETFDERQAVAADALEALTKLNVNEADRVIRDLDIQRALGAEAGLRNKAKSIIYDVIPFNIQGIFGNPELTKEVTEKQLINCFLVSNEMIVSADDQPLKERYSFIGQVHK
jgi:hypothetical protein